jgi:pantoate--beta-alanine ligase
VVVSLFVNPAQFSRGEDFRGYPRDAERDRALCEQEGVDVMFCPGSEEMYAERQSVFVEETQLSNVLCGASRPGHFRGVTTVVAKLLNIVLPDVAVFGRKDFQQAKIIERMVRQLDFSVEVVVAPTVREPDGLAMSSRNVYLSEAERTRALSLYRALCLAERLVAEGTVETGAVRCRMRELIEDGTPPVDIDYIEMADAQTLAPVDRVEGPTAVLLAVNVGEARLIDNTILSPPDVRP